MAAAARHPGVVWATVGLHPHDAKLGLDGLVGCWASPGVVAVGECGLDYHYEHSPRATQREAFAAQIGWAHEHDLALMIHTREAWDDTFAVLDAEGVPERTVFHCFTGGPGEAEACLDRGGHLSFSGIVSFPSADDVRAAAALCPLDRAAGRDRQPLPRTGPAPGPAQPAGAGPGGGRGAGRGHGRAGRGGRRRHLGQRRAGLPPAAASARDAEPPPGARPARRARALAQPGAGAELRGRPQHGAAHRPAGRGRPGRPGGRDRPRPGSLTLALAETGATVTAVELDRHLLPALRRWSSPPGCGWCTATP